MVATIGTEMPNLATVSFFGRPGARGASRVLDRVCRFAAVGLSAGGVAVGASGRGSAS